MYTIYFAMRIGPFTDKPKIVVLMQLQNSLIALILLLLGYICGVKIKFLLVLAHFFRSQIPKEHKKQYFID